MASADFTASQEVCSVEIPLNEELVNTLHRRSRRQLRNIQVSSTAVIKLCRMRKVLHVSGTMEAISLVRNQLQGLNGPRKQVRAAVWAELMRTRTSQTEEQAALPDAPASIASMQEISGCRIHVERTRCEVRLFGSEESVQKASQLIDALADECVEEPVTCGLKFQMVGRSPTSSSRCTLDNKTTVLGLRDAVSNATEHLRNCIAGEVEWPLPKVEEQRSEAEKGSDGEYATNNALHLDVRSACSNSSDSNEVGRRSDSNQLGRLAVLPPAPAQQCQPEAKAMQQMCSQLPGEQPCQAAAPSCCPTCGAGRFCVGCGAPVFQNSGNWVWVANDEAASAVGHATSKMPPMGQQGGKGNHAQHPSHSHGDHMMQNEYMNQQQNQPKGQTRRQQGIKSQHNAEQAPRLPQQNYMNYDGAYAQQGGASAMMVPMCFPNGMQGMVPQGVVGGAQTYMVPTMMNMPQNLNLDGFHGGPYKTSTVDSLPESGWLAA